MKSKKIKLVFIITIQMSITLFFTQLGIGAQTQDEAKREVLRKLESLTSLIKPSTKQKVLQSSNLLRGKLLSPGVKTDFYSTSFSNIKGLYNDMSSADIDALVEIVMFELWKTEEEDLKEMVDEMHKMNELKKKQREYIESLKKQKASMNDKLRESYKDASAVPGGQGRVAEIKFLRETAKTSRLGIKYTKTPVVPILKDPRKMSASEIDEAMDNLDKNKKNLDDISQLQEGEMQDLQQRQASFWGTITYILKARGDSLKVIVQNMK